MALAILFESEADLSARRLPALDFVSELYKRLAIALFDGDGSVESFMFSEPSPPPVQLADLFINPFESEPFARKILELPFMLVKSVDWDLREGILDECKFLYPDPRSKSGVMLPLP